MLDAQALTPLRLVELFRPVSRLRPDSKKPLRPRARSRPLDTEPSSTINPGQPLMFGWCDSEGRGSDFLPVGCKGEVGLGRVASHHKGGASRRSVRIATEVQEYWCIPSKYPPGVPSPSSRQLRSDYKRWRLPLQYRLRLPNPYRTGRYSESHIRPPVKTPPAEIDPHTGLWDHILTVVRVRTWHV